jgi:hypothetical protein
MRRDSERISMPKGYGLAMVIIVVLACITVVLLMAR